MQYDYWPRANSRLNLKRQKKRKPVRISVLVLAMLGVYAAHFFLSVPVTGQPPLEQASVLAVLEEVDPEALPEITAPPDPWDLALAPELQKKNVTVASGDTLINILLKAGLPGPDAYNLCSTMGDVFSPGDLRQGQELILSFEEGAEDGPLFTGLTLKLDVDREVQVIRCPDQAFQVREYTHELEARPARAAAEIESSLYEAAVKADLPIPILMEMVRAYSYDIDFQRDIQPGDKFEILYEEKVNRRGEVLKPGGMLYVSLHTGGRTLPIYRYVTSEGAIGYFDDKGKSVRKTLMVTPIDGARISSRYGMRRHPVQGYNKMHKGLDFAAPTGTPIMAAGDGIVEYAGRNGGYGNCIRIRHPNDYKTIYAHMSRFAPGIKNGDRIKQGFIIGYVGSTGVSTGPHLHYEVVHMGKSINPVSVKSPPGRALAGEELKKFLVAKNRLETTFASLEKPTLLARKDN